MAGTSPIDLMSRLEDMIDTRPEAIACRAMSLDDSVASTRQQAAASTKGMTPT